MTGDTDLDAALIAYREAKTVHVLELLATAAAFGTPDQAEEATSILAIIDRINTTGDTRKSFFSERLKQATARLQNYTARYTTETTP